MERDKVNTVTIRDTELRVKKIYIKCSFFYVRY